MELQLRACKHVTRSRSCNDTEHKTGFVGNKVETRYGDTGDRTLDKSGIVRQREMLHDV